MPGPNVRRRLVVFGGLCTLAFAVVARAQETARLQRPVRIAVLTSSWGPPPVVGPFTRHLIELGYAEGTDFFIATWFTEGDNPALYQRAREIVAAGVDIIVPVGAVETDAVRLAAPDHPIVFMYIGDPVAQGQVRSYAHPGGNMTGVAELGDAVAGKRLQLFAELVPAMRRVVLPFDRNDPYEAAQAGKYRAAAARLGIGFAATPLATADDAIAYVGGITRDDWGGILSPSDVGLNIPGLVIEATRTRGVPSMFDGPNYVDVGGLAAYGPPVEDQGRRGADIVDQIIRGISPAEIPVQAVTRQEFVINLATAAVLGMTIDPVILFKADRLFR